MKKFIVYLVVVTMLFGMAQSVKAQKRKVTKTPTVTRMLKPAPKSVSLKATKYEVKAKSVFLGKDYIYYVEDNDNNAVMGISRKTGLTEVIIPGIGNVYEGRRATITYCMECDGRLVLETKRNFKADGVYVYDGKSLATSKKIAESELLLDCSSKYLLVRCCKGFDRYGLVMDVGLNVKNKWNQELERTSYHVADDGTIWDWNANGMNGRDLRQMTGKHLYNYDLMRVPYVAQAYAEDEYDTKIECVQLQGNYIYVAIGRRLLRRDADGNVVLWDHGNRVSSIYIYNPNNIVGFAETRGKIVKL